MYNKINKFCAIIILLSMGIIAVYASIQTAFMTGLVTALVAPPAAVLAGRVNAGKKLLSDFEKLLIPSSYDDILNGTVKPTAGCHPEMTYLEK